MATISIRGLPTMEEGRDVFLFVETIGMPPPMTERDFAAGAAPLRQPLDPALGRRYEAGELSSGELEARMPTYRVHVFHDTGVMRGGARVLRAQPHFGFHLHHEGDFAGWAHRLRAPGLLQIRPNLYRLHIGAGGVARVNVRIESVHLPPMDDALEGALSRARSARR